MVLIWGIAGEAPLAAVTNALREQGTPFFLLDQERISGTSIEGLVGAELGGRIRCGDESLELGTVTAAYLRPYGPEQISALAGADPQGPLWQHAGQVGEFLWTWADTTRALVVNRPSAMHSNYSKPWQEALIRAHGFATPDTLITNDRAGVRRFWRHHGEIIYKSISSQRSIVARVSRSVRERWPDLVHCPTQFQAWIPGTDVRVHVVGDDLFACEIQTDADDYRYASDGFSMQRCGLPVDCAQRCRTLAKALDLFVTGIDLRRTPEGRWYCFEANPSPGFTFFDADGKQGIAAAIARALLNAQVAD
jgi:hypothetical protein